MESNEPFGSLLSSLTGSRIVEFGHPDYLEGYDGRERMCREEARRSSLQRQQRGSQPCKSRRVMKKCVTLL